ncbi:LPXTG cell wall anchor domain-containing protein [Frisingicoccus sp.]|uniref:LPXTG cell wall anchor domain-containing protein n=1 Tax=Frisingicoccus sp. TaxID=1918627 RepID=UPI003866CD40
MNGKHKKIIIILIALLLLSLLALIGMNVRKKDVIKEPASVVVPDNVITSEDETTEKKDSKGKDTKDKETVNKNTENKNTEQKPANQTPGSIGASNPETSAGVSGQTTEIKEKVTLSISKNNAADQTPFAVGNMFPGDMETKDYCIKVTHKDKVTLKFTADIHTGYEKLAEVLKMKIVLKGNNTVLYDGLMKDVPEYLDHLVVGNTTSTTEEITYVISTYLDTSVGNPYMNKELKADFKWWVEEKENLTQPATGEGSHMKVWFGIMGASLITLILLVKKKKEVKANDRS